jgi:hypothetical protein
MRIKYNFKDIFLTKYLIMFWVLIVLSCSYSYGADDLQKLTTNDETKTEKKSESSSVSNQPKNKPMKLEINLFPIPSGKCSSISRISDWTKKEEKITIRIPTGSERKVNVYVAKYVIRSNSSYPSYSSEQSMGIVFDENKKPIWFGLYDGYKKSQFVEVENELFWFRSIVREFKIMIFNSNLIEKQITEALQDQSVETLDKFVKDNYPYGYHYAYKSITCTIHNYFSNPYFAIGEHSLELKKVEADNGLLRFDIGTRDELKSVDPRSDGSLWLNLKKGTVEKVEDRTKYPPNMIRTRIRNVQ